MRIPPKETWRHFKHPETQSLVRDWVLPPGVTPADLVRPYDRLLYAEIQATIQRATYQWQAVEQHAHAKGLDLRTYYETLSTLTLHLRRRLRGHDTPHQFPVVACACGHTHRPSQDVTTCYACKTRHTWNGTSWTPQPPQTITIQDFLSRGWSTPP